MSQSFIERQFPVSKVSKESYKERKAVQGQTLPSLGKWWGRKPLVLVRATVLGCLMPASDNPSKDMEIFLKILSMDSEGLWARKNKLYSIADLFEVVSGSKKLEKYQAFFYEEDGKIKLDKDAPRFDIEKAVFLTKGYDEQLEMCLRPEQLENIPDDCWNDINLHLGTSANSLPELIKQLSLKRYGHNIVVGDCFCGGGSIPFEASRIGANIYASDLNPVATLLTWGCIHVFGNQKAATEFAEFQRRLKTKVEAQIAELSIDVNSDGDAATNFLYCTEATCPECGWVVPLSSSWLVGKGSKTVAILSEN